VTRYESLGIVLRRWPYSENSLVAHLISPEHGMVSVLAKGVYRLASGKAGVLDTHALVRFSFHERPNQELSTLAHAELLDRFSAISRRRKSLQVSAILAELAELAAPAGQKSPQVFLALVESFQELQAGANPDELLARRTFQFLRLLGLQPDFAAAKQGEAAWFSVDSGHLLAPQSTRPESNALQLSATEIEACVQLALAGPDPSRVPTDHLSACLTMLGRFLAFHLERPPRAWQDYEDGARLAHNTR